jgi:hypothetical protein
MKSIFVSLAILLSAASIATAQEPSAATSEQIGTSVTDKDQNSNLPRAATALPTPTPTPDATSSTSVYIGPDAATRRKRFINATVGPVALGKMAASAGYSTWRNSPEEWGTKWEGFGRRFASSFGKNAIKQTTKYGLDEALKYDSHFYRTDKSPSTATRLKWALISPVTARNRNNRRVVGVPNLVGTYASSIIAYETWYPDRYNWKDGVRSGTISLGFQAAFNVFKEFVRWKK